MRVPLDVEMAWVCPDSFDAVWPCVLPRRIVGKLGSPFMNRPG